MSHERCGLSFETPRKARLLRMTGQCVGLFIITALG
jgi:hypothetical protein